MLPCNTIWQAVHAENFFFVMKTKLQTEGALYLQMFSKLK